MLKNNSKKAAALYLSVMIMAMLLAIALGISTIFLGQVGVMKGLGYSAIAFYAADAGIEKVLIDRENLDLTPDHYSGSLNNGATYQVAITTGGLGSCTATNFCIKSIGRYKETNRAIEVTY